MGTILDVATSGILLGGLYALIAMGLSLQYGVARVFNVAHGEFIMVGAFIAWAFFQIEVNPLITLVIVGPATFIVGYILHRTLFNWLRIKAPSPGALEGNSILAAFGLLFLIQGVALIIWGGDIHGYNFLNTAVELQIVTVPANRLVTLGFAVGISVVFYLFLSYTRTGKAIRAAAQDPATAGLMGVNIKRVLALCFGLGALMAAAAGVLLSTSYSLWTNMGLKYTIIAIIVVVLGGMGSIVGSFIGGFILGIVGAVVSYYDPGLSLVAYYGIFTVLLLIKPTGLFGK